MYLIYAHCYVCTDVDLLQSQPADSPNTSDTRDDLEDFQPSVENISLSETCRGKTAPPELT